MACLGLIIVNTQEIQILPVNQMFSPCLSPSKDKLLSQVPPLITLTSVQNTVKKNKQTKIAVK